MPIAPCIHVSTPTCDVQTRKHCNMRTSESIQHAYLHVKTHACKRACNNAETCEHVTDMLTRSCVHRMRHATCDMRHATCNMQHATCNMRHAACHMPHATCDMRHATCDMRPAPCSQAEAGRIPALAHAERVLHHHEQTSDLLPPI